MSGRKNEMLGKAWRGLGKAWKGLGKINGGAWTGLDRVLDNVFAKPRSEKSGTSAGVPQVQGGG